MIEYQFSGEMLFKVSFIPEIRKRAFASAVLAKLNGDQVVLKEMLCKHRDNKVKEILKEIKIFTIAY